MARLLSSTLALCVAQLAASGVAHAQTAAPSQVQASQPVEDGVLAEVIVTAERRSQSLQRLPTTASALSAADLQAQQVQGVEGLIKTTPSFSINDTGAAKAVNVRGVGKSLTAPGVQAGVAYYVDGVPLPNDLFLNTPFFDLSRVELLRGPQGTLVGMNSTGGALLIVTQNPIYGEFGGSIEQSAGNHGDYRTRASINIPLGEKWAAHAATEIEDRDSFYSNVGPADSHPGDVERRAVRGTISGRPTDALEIYLRGEYIRTKSDGPAGKPVPGDPDPAYAGILAASPSDPFQLSRDIATYSNTRYYRLSGQAQLDLGPFELRSITGYQKGELRSYSDVDASAAPVEQNGTQVNEPVVSQEINLISKPGGSLDWVLGYFYLAQNTNGFVNIALSPSGTPLVDIIGKTRLRNQGLFGQATYHVTEALNLTAGLRFNKERHYYGDGGQTSLFGGAIVLPLVGESTDKAVTGRVTLDYQLASDQFLYATVSRGFKGGGLNTDATSFGPEFIWNYEAGLKSTFLDGHIRTQAGVFLYDNKSIQLQVYSPITGQTTVTNAGGGTNAGLELQGQGQFGALGLSATAAYTRSKFDDTLLIDPRYGVTTPVNIGGRDYLFSPKFTFSGGVDYAFHLDNGFTLTPRVQYSYTGPQWASVFQVQPTDRIKSRGLVDATLRLTSQAKGWSAELYGVNLTDETYVASKSVSDAGPGRVQYYGPPRQYGVRIGYAF